MRYVLVCGNAINRESGENPEQTRYCNSYKTHRHNATVSLADGKASASRISQETCQDSIVSWLSWIKVCGKIRICHL